VKLEPDKNKKDALERKQFEMKKQRADAGNMSDLFAVAMDYWFGNETLGIGRGDKKHSELVREVFAYELKAAATGDASSLIKLGDSYSVGEVFGAPKDKFLAEQAYRAAIAKGSAEAKVSLEKLLAE